MLSISAFQHSQILASGWAGRAHSPASRAAFDPSACCTCTASWQGRGGDTLMAGPPSAACTGEQRHTPLLPDVVSTPKTLVNMALSSGCLRSRRVVVAAESAHAAWPIISERPSSSSGSGSRGSGSGSSSSGSGSGNGSSRQLTPACVPAPQLADSCACSKGVGPKLGHRCCPHFWRHRVLEQVLPRLAGASILCGFCCRIGDSLRPRWGLWLRRCCCRRRPWWRCRQPSRRLWWCCASCS